MISKKDLKRYGEWLEKHRDHADEYGENTLYRAALLGGRSDNDTESGHKILCPEMPASIRKVEIAVRRLPRHIRGVIEVWYSAPLRSDGTTYTASQLARLFGMSTSEFNRLLHQGHHLLKGN